jgi:hypothetical protein
MKMTDTPSGGPEMTKTVVSLSGGAGSWAAGKRAAASEDVILLFCDTLIEDADLYRFLIEGAANILGLDPSGIYQQPVEIYEDEAQRKKDLQILSKRAMDALPGLVWLIDGRTPWDVFHDVRYVGNTRTAHCSQMLKTKMAKDWCVENNVDNLIIGIDWTESHRLPVAQKTWEGVCEVSAPLCEKPYLGREDIFDMLAEEGIEKPRLYKMGYAHNNCGGFCVRAGQAQFEALYRENPNLYAYHEEKQNQIHEAIPTARYFLRETRDGVLNYISLKEWREKLDGGAQHDLFDFGGCGCFVDD